MLSDSILLSIVASAVGVLSLLIRFCYISKCTNVNLCCGLVNIKRDVEEETENGKNHENNNIQNQQENV
jgi:hypothetical protein